MRVPRDVERRVDEDLRVPLRVVRVEVGRLALGEEPSSDATTQHSKSQARSEETSGGRVARLQHRFSSCHHSLLDVSSHTWGPLVRARRRVAVEAPIA